MKKFNNLTCTLEDSILVLAVNRPASLNALNRETLQELDVAIEEIYKDAEIVGVIITGVGEKAFVAGADIKEFTGLDRQKALEMALFGQNVFSKIENCPKPVIAAINGFALGGGCELAMACHIRVALENARLGQPETNLGIIPGYGGTQRLTQLAGKGKAFELILTGDLISAKEGKELGLVNYTVSTHEELMSLAKTILKKILSKGPVAVAKAIKSINAVNTTINGYQLEAENFAACAVTEDFKEGTAAFIEKRQPIFKGN